MGRYYRLSKKITDDMATAINFYDHVLMNQDEYDDYKSKRAEMNWKMFRQQE